MANSPHIADPLDLDEIVKYHDDVLSALYAFFRNSSRDFTARYGGHNAEEIQAFLTARLEETDLRSALILLAAVEAAFRIDYQVRCKQKLKDDLSREFRGLYKKYELRVRLEDDILEVWKKYYPGQGALIGELRGAFKFRHWLAHGRYYDPKLGRRYDYQSVFTLADAALHDLEFKSSA